MKKVDNRALVEHLEKAEQKISAWPQWQQQIFRSKVTSQSSHLSKPQAVKEPSTSN
ncbi:hypothetical protein P0Y67_04980 [Photobacterium sp. SP02]|uniref:hypothetical protein n=1 Tax=Photobacterium sp. SP02 TaxID=3032280 RepID=UPI003144F8FC